MSNLTLSRMTWNKETYASLLARLGERDCKVIANNTSLEKASLGLGVLIRYHWTKVAIFNYKGEIALYTGGHHTATTKERLNFALQGYASVYQKNFYWFLVYNGETYSFIDGMIVDTANERILDMHRNVVTPIQAK